MTFVVPLLALLGVLDRAEPGDGDTVSSSTATATPSTPNAPRVKRDPEADNAAVDDIWRAFTTAAGENIGDTLRCSIPWTQYGSSFTGTTMTVSTNDTFACWATDSVSVSVSVSVLGATTTVGDATAATI